MVILLVEMKENEESFGGGMWRKKKWKESDEETKKTNP
jgi:hypothetical protein